MKTSLFTRGSPSFHEPCARASKIMWMPWKTKGLLQPCTTITPFIRKMSVPRSFSSFVIQVLSLSKSHSPGCSIPTEPTEESCWWSWLSLKNSASASKTRSNEKPRMPRIWSRSTRDCWVRIKGAAPLICRISDSSSASSSSEARSVLLSKIRSAKAICSTASFSTPSGFSSRKCCKQCFASTTVMMPSRTIWAWMWSSAKNVCATGAGSARPVVSMMTPSSLEPEAADRFRMLLRPWMRSPRTVQQMQPLFISMICSEPRSSREAISASSMPISPNSFSITAKRLPCVPCRMWLRSVVLPAPKKPVSMWAGTLLWALRASDSATSWS
mmetsp:Transcript_145559/g.362996  ORF Transcript_145559/g.362996 Transcript_145559/m.362996 type:complete len:328 (-) Transcript_145559:447-1430(-)